MKIFRKKLGIVVLIILALTLSSCTKKDKGEVKETEGEEIAEELEEEVQEDLEEEVEISDDLYDYEIVLDGVVYKLPADISELLENGWVADDDLDEMELEPNTHTLSQRFSKDDTQVYFRFVNFEDDVLPLSECLVYGVSTDEYYAEIEDVLEFAKGINLGSSENDIIEAYGEPTERMEGDTSDTLIYGSGYSLYRIVVDKDTDKVYSLEVENLAESSEADSSDDGDSEIPKVVEDYKAPTDVGKDLLDFQVKYDGDYYELPIPIVEMEKNGWKLEDDPNLEIPAKEFATGISMRKGNETLRTSITNYSDKAVPLKHCFINYIEYYDLGAKIPLELPNGISEKSTIKEVKDAYGEPDDTSESTSFKYYKYGKVHAEVVFVEKDGKISKIEIHHSPKDID